MTQDDSNVVPITDAEPAKRRTISDADARAIAMAMMKVAIEEIYNATGRGIWSTAKTLFWPLILAVGIYFWAWQGKPLPVHPQ